LSRHRIALIPGDGIGGEVIPSAMSVVEEAGKRFDIAFEWTEYPWSCERYVETGSMMPADGLDQLASADAILLGAVGWPGVPDHISLWGLLIPIRRHFQQYINLRPIRLMPGIASPLADRSASDIDMVIVRENSEGEYSSIGGRIFQGTPEEVVVQQSVFTRRGVERTVRYAFDLAATRAGTLTSATKSNGIIHTMPFWDEVVEDVASDYPNVTVRQIHIDALAADFVLRPERHDVVVGSNLFGDILSDLGAAVAGSIGIAPSANLNPERTGPSMFEPVHGSAPDIAGTGVANPLGAIWSAAMMLDHLGHDVAAAAVVSACERALESSECTTPDLGGSASTTEFTHEVISILRDINS